MNQDSYLLLFFAIWVVVFLCVLVRSFIKRKNFNYEAEYDELGLKAQAKILEIRPGKTKILQFKKTLMVKVEVYPRHIPEFKTYLYIDNKEKERRRLKQGDLIDVVYSVTTKNVNILN